jgi:hypothetical protein
MLKSVPITPEYTYHRLSWKSSKNPKTRKKNLIGKWKRGKKERRKEGENERTREGEKGRTREREGNKDRRPRRNLKDAEQYGPTGNFFEKIPFYIHYRQTTCSTTPITSQA